MNEINEKSEILEIYLENYKIIGLPFYNKELENDFENTFNKLIEDNV